VTADERSDDRPDDADGNAQGVLLDLDGTLIDSVYVHVHAWDEAFRTHGYDVPHAAIHAAIGLGSDRLVPHLVGHGAPADDLADAHRRCFLSRVEQLRPTPGALALVEDLEHRNVPFVIATSADAEERTALLEALDRPDLPAVDASEVQRSKPAPELLLLAARSLGRGGHDLTVVGDAPWDARAARAAGMRAVAVSTGGFGEDTLRRAGAEHVVATPRDLVGLL
jgi:HAD superfamily hydrolase (TIGR01509 family)